MDGDKENSKGGCLSKLSPSDKQSIIHQVTTGKPDNAVQATHFINNTLSNPVTPQTVRNALKEDNFHSIVKQKHPLLKKVHRLDHFKVAKYHENWTVDDWKRIFVTIALHQVMVVAHQEVQVQSSKEWDVKYIHLGF